MKFDGIAIEYGMDGREINVLYKHGCLKNIPVKMFKDPTAVPVGWLPYGSVPFVEKLLGRSIVPKYFPDFLSTHIKRKVWRLDNTPPAPTEFPLHVKPADAYKRFDGKIFENVSELTHLPPYWVSELVSLKNEWRYYISSGCIAFSGWYRGEPSEPDAPRFPETIPADFSGAVDFAELVDGSLMLIESHHPFSCGFYGASPDESRWVHWLWDGWLYLNKTEASNN